MAIGYMEMTVWNMVFLVKVSNVIRIMYILQSDNCLDLLSCTSLTYNVQCHALNYVRGGRQSMSVTHNGEWDMTDLVSRTTDLSDLSESG